MNLQQKAFMDSLSKYGADLDTHSMFVMFKICNNLDIKYSCALVYEDLYRIGTKFGFSMEPEFPKRNYPDDLEISRICTLIEWHEANGFEHLIAHEGFGLVRAEWPELVVMIRTKEMGEE